MTMAELTEAPHEETGKVKKVRLLGKLRKGVKSGFKASTRKLASTFSRPFGERNLSIAVGTRSSTGGQNSDLLKATDSLNISRESEVSTVPSSSKSADGTSTGKRREGAREDFSAMEESEESGILETPVSRAKRHLKPVNSLDFSHKTMAASEISSSVISASVKESYRNTRSVQRHGRSHDDETADQKGLYSAFFQKAMNAVIEAASSSYDSSDSDGEEDEDTTLYTLSSESLPTHFTKRVVASPSDMSDVSFFTSDNRSLMPAKILSLSLRHWDENITHVTKNAEGWFGLKTKEVENMVQRSALAEEKLKENKEKGASDITSGELDGLVDSMEYIKTSLDQLKSRTTEATRELSCTGEEQQFIGDTFDTTMSFVKKTPGFKACVPEACVPEACVPEACAPDADSFREP